MCAADPRIFTHTVTHRNTSCLSYQWQCANLECINAEFVCDGNIDCLDKSDELPGNCVGEGNVIRFYSYISQPSPLPSPTPVPNVDIISCKLVNPDGSSLHGSEVQFFSSSLLPKLTWWEAVAHANLFRFSLLVTPYWQLSFRSFTHRPSSSHTERERLSPFLVPLIAINRRTPEECTRDQFFCDDTCFDRGIRCNGQIECTDRSDEHDCHLPTFPRHPSYPMLPCPQHTCPSGRCYTESERCDGHRHCEDNSDEANCKFALTS